MSLSGLLQDVRAEQHANKAAAPTICMLLDQYAILLILHCNKMMLYNEEKNNRI